jgi:hypothetical protein
MLEQISALVKQYGKEVVIDNPDIPNEENNAVLAEATNTITGGMQNMLAGGGLQDIISMFTGGGNNQGNKGSGIGGLVKNPMVSMMIGHLVSKLVGKFNMNPGQASQVANNLIPNVLNGLVTRTASSDPSDSGFDLNDLIGSLTGGNAATANSGGGFNFQGLIEQFTGGGNGGSSNGSNGGGFDLQDIISQVTRGAQQNQEQQAKGGGGITDLIKGFFN